MPACGLSNSKFRHLLILRKNCIMPKFNVLEMHYKEDYRQRKLDVAHQVPALPKKLGILSLSLCRGYRFRGNRGKSYGDDRPMADLTGQVDSAAMVFNNFVRQRQP